MTNWRQSNDRVAKTPAAIELRPIGVVRSPHRSTADVPKGLGARHAAEGTIELRLELADGLRDIEGFSHLP